MFVNLHDYKYDYVEKLTVTRTVYLASRRVLQNGLYPLFWNDSWQYEDVSLGDEFWLVSGRETIHTRC